MKHLACSVILTLLLKVNAFAQPSPKKSPILNHIAVYVTDLKTSTRFYQHIVGLDTIPEPFHDGRHTWFSIGTHGHLHIISGAAAKTPHDKNSHLCFSVTSINDFITVLKQNGVEFENWVGEKNTVTTRVDGVKQL